MLKFDNSYSWARSKEVFYSVELLPPDMADISTPLKMHAADENKWNGDGDGDEEGFFDCGNSSTCRSSTPDYDARVQLSGV